MNKEIIGRIYQERRGLMFGVAFAHTGNPQDAEDVVEEAGLRKKSSIRREESSILQLLQVVVVGELSLGEEQSSKDEQRPNNKRYGDFL